MPNVTHNPQRTSKYLSCFACGVVKPTNAIKVNGADEGEPVLL